MPAHRPPSEAKQTLIKSHSTNWIFKYMELGRLNNLSGGLLAHLSV